MIGERYQLTYSQEFDQTQGNILKVNAEIIEYLMENDELIISGGDAASPCIFSTASQTFALKSINLPTTSLVLAPSPHHIPNLMPIVTETLFHLKAERYLPRFHELYSTMIAEEWEQEQWNEGIFELLSKHGSQMKQICQKWQISEGELNKMRRWTVLARFEREDLQESINLCNNSIMYLPIPLSTVLRLQRQLLPILTGLNLSCSFFSAQDIHNRLNIGHPKVIDAIGTCFKWQKEQGGRWRIGREGILEFIVLELVIAKQEYIAHEMDDLLKNMLNIYLPVEYQSESISPLLSKVVSHHFLTIPKHPVPTRIHYKAHLLESSAKVRLKWMSQQKNRFTQHQIRGVFAGMEEEVEDIIMKSFRKYGEQYEIKLVMPK